MWPLLVLLLLLLLCGQWQILRHHHPPLDVRGKTILVVKDSGLLDASAEPEQEDVRFQPPPTPHLHPFHEQVYVGVQADHSDIPFAPDLGLHDQRLNTPHTPLARVASAAGFTHITGAAADGSSMPPTPSHTQHRHPPRRPPAALPPVYPLSAAPGTAAAAGGNSASTPSFHGAGGVRAGIPPAALASPAAGGGVGGGAAPTPLPHVGAAHAGSPYAVVANPSAPAGFSFPAPGTPFAATGDDGRAHAHAPASVRQHVDRPTGQSPPLQLQRAPQLPAPVRGPPGAARAVPGQYATHGYRGVYGTGDTHTDSAVDLLLRTARRDGARSLSPLPLSGRTHNPPGTPALPATPSSVGSHRAHGACGSAATPQPAAFATSTSATATTTAMPTSTQLAHVDGASTGALPVLPRPMSAATAAAAAAGSGAAAAHHFSVQSFMVHAAKAQPESFKAHSRLVSRLNQVRTTFLHYQTIYQQHERVFQRTWGAGQAPPPDLDSRKLLHEALPQAQFSEGLQLTGKEAEWPVRPAGATNYGVSRLPDGSDVTNKFRLPAKVCVCVCVCVYVCVCVCVCVHVGVCVLGM